MVLLHCRLSQNEWNPQKFGVMYPFLAKFRLFLPKLPQNSAKTGKIGSASRVYSALILLSTLGEAGR